MAVSSLHPIQRRYLAEDLFRLRRANDRTRSVASQRAGRVDPNPHQIDAVVFALSRVPEGGCILADEVGLGKTIEAGLVIAQLMAEGATRVLLVTPRPLMGQWRQELLELFGIETTEARPNAGAAAYQGSGVFLVGREQAGSERGAAALSATERFDLCVVDEAHEVFAAIYKRFDADGLYRDDAKLAQIAGRFRAVVRAWGTPLLLLTATPLQNSLTELWGLVQYIDPTGTLLNDLATFRQVFCPDDDRTLAEGQAEELKRRLSSVVQRTLRRQAQDFMRKPFVDRRAQLFEYTMSPPELALYNDVTAYLMERNICAFRGSHRRLLLIGFHRRMGSSVPALAASLQKVAERLEGMLTGAVTDGSTDAILDAFIDDLGDELDDLGDDIEVVFDGRDAPSPAKIQAELDRVRGYVERARSLPGDAKATALCEAVRLVLERAEEGKGAGRVVIFTESLTTQAYLRDVLLSGTPLGEGDVTLFRGHNSSPRVDEALARWQAEVVDPLPGSARPSRDAAVRLALVHEFRTRSRVFISTEAGAKGLNLQFCDTLVNYDLPWNPQRIEQRIGRCHRYGQVQTVTVINFLATDNEAQRLTLEILGHKLDLFGRVLDASDAVLHEPRTDSPELVAGALGAGLEARMREIYDEARSIAEVEAELRALRETIEQRRVAFERAYERTAGLIESRLDAKVRAAFSRIESEAPAALRAFDQRIEVVVLAFLDAIGAGWSRGATSLDVSPSPHLPEALRGGARIATAPASGDGGALRLHLGHPLVQAALQEAREATRRPTAVSVRVPDALAEHRGAQGRLQVIKVRFSGIEPTERLLVVALTQAGALDCETARALLDGAIEDWLPLGVAIDPLDLEDAVEEAIFVAQAEVAAEEQARFEDALEQLERFVEDRILVLERRLAILRARHDQATRSWSAATGRTQRDRAEARKRRAQERIDSVETDLARLHARADDEYQRWRQRAETRRFDPPAIERILDVAFELR